MRIAVVFRPRPYFGDRSRLRSYAWRDFPDHARQGDIEPGITCVLYPQYPVNAALPGTVLIFAPWPSLNQS